MDRTEKLRGSRTAANEGLAVRLARAPALPRGGPARRPAGGRLAQVGSRAGRRGRARWRRQVARGSRLAAAARARRRPMAPRPAVPAPRRPARGTGPAQPRPAGRGDRTTAAPALRTPALTSPRGLRRTSMPVTIGRNHGAGDRTPSRGAAPAQRRSLRHRRGDRDDPDLPRGPRSSPLRGLRPAQGRGRHRGAARLLRAVRRPRRRARRRAHPGEPHVAGEPALGRRDRLLRRRAGPLQPAGDRADGGDPRCGRSDGRAGRDQRLHRTSRRRLPARRDPQPGRGGGLPLDPDRELRRHLRRHGHRDHDDLRGRGGRPDPCRPGGGDAGRHLLHGRDRRPPAERPGPGRGDRAGRRGDGGRPRLLHDQLRSPDPLRGRARRRVVERADPRAARERLADEPRGARRCG